MWNLARVSIDAWIIIWARNRAETYHVYKNQFWWYKINTDDHNDKDHIKLVYMGDHNKEPIYVDKETFDKYFTVE